ncbi:hypothetical protein PJ985_03725 [Streptomyces sp. ACA25]|uniref:hypothetical protein n=1 Tax=Streptomyces sp. ACA25 TaxID=3022596 RepID=UPI0023077FB0|nr:hypothetical protein [Streptomyces sp. ACA25]MDB1086677.1 hypothetical protein [Streptomyces sp. ACA25]
MGSLRTPIGPLPSSIYWRRRAVMLLLLAVLALLVFWALRTSGGTDSTGSGADDAAGGPAPSLTPGPTDGESHSDERPGGREDSDEEDADEDGDGDGGGSGDGSGEDGTGGDADDGDGPEGDGRDSEDGEAGDGGGSGEAQAGAGAAVAGLPDCRPSRLTLSLRSAENAYPPGERPELQLTLRNESGTDCRIDVGHGALELTLSQGDDEVWNSQRCPKGDESELLRVPANGTAVHTVVWDRRHSPEDCDGSRGRAAATGTTYLAEAELPGFTVTPISFRLDKD